MRFRYKSLFLLSVATMLGGVNAGLDAVFVDRGERAAIPFFGPSAYKGIILGSSHAMNGIQPAVLDGPGLTFFNCGAQGASPRYTNHWYRLAREVDRRPQLLLYEVDWFMFSFRNHRYFEVDCGHFPWLFIARMATWPDIDVYGLLSNRIALSRHRMEVQQWVTGRLKRDESVGGSTGRGWSRASAPATPGAFRRWRHDRPGGC